MTTAPSLFSVAPNNRPEESTADRPARSLVDLLYDGFYMLILLSQRSVPRDTDEFSGNIQKFLDQFERSAKKNKRRSLAPEMPTLLSFVLTTISNALSLMFSWEWAYNKFNLNHSGLLEIG